MVLFSSSIINIQKKPFLGEEKKIMLMFYVGKLVSMLCLASCSSCITPQVELSINLKSGNSPNYIQEKKITYLKAPTSWIKIVNN